MWKYVRKAFARPLNLAAVAVGVVVAVVSGRPDVGLPVVGLLQAGWLAFAATNPRFQQFVDIQEHQALKADDALETQRRMRMMRASLPRTLQRRFERLKEQCDELRGITKEYRDANRNLLPSLNDEDMSGLDRIMWLYLKLLYTEHSLNRFFDTTSIDSIDREIQQTESRLRQEQSRPADQQRSRLVETLTESVKAANQRRQNYHQAKDSYELVLAEQKHLENRVANMKDVGVHQRDTATLSADVDAVEDTVHKTESTLADLEFVTGFSTFENEPVPEIVSRRQTVQVAR